MEKLNAIEKRLDKIENSCGAMDTHIGFVDGVYTTDPKMIKDSKKIKVNLKVSKNKFFTIRPLAMKRAMDNLLSNALFYAKKKVLVRVNFYRCL